MTGCPLLDSEYAARQNGKRLPCERLAEENERLRELVRAMWFGLNCPTEPADGCSQCSFNKDGECFFEQRIRELGIEVDE